MNSSTPADPVERLRTLEPGTRVVVRYRIDGGQTDALGELLRVDAALCVVDTRRGPVSVALDSVTAAKPVPPAPARRRPRA